MRRMGTETDMTQIDLINRGTECTLNNPKIIKMTEVIKWVSKDHTSNSIEKLLRTIPTKDKANMTRTRDLKGNSSTHPPPTNTKIIDFSNPNLPINGWIVDIRDTKPSLIQVTKLKATTHPNKDSPITNSTNNTIHNSANLTIREDKIHLWAIKVNNKGTLIRVIKEEIAWEDGLQTITNSRVINNKCGKLLKINKTDHNRTTIIIRIKISRPRGSNKISTSKTDLIAFKVTCEGSELYL